MKHLQVRLEDDEYAVFKRKAQAAGFDSVQDAGKNAILGARWEDGADSEVPARRRPLLKLLAKLLAVCEDSTADALRTVLNAMMKQSEVRRTEPER